MKKKTKALFLDCDGVLNKYSDFEENAKMLLKLIENGHKLKDKQQYEVLNNDMVKRYKRMVKGFAGEVTIVLSSTWRCHPNLMEFLQHRGIKFDDVTLDFHGYRDYGNRGDEVMDWLCRHPEVTKYAIVDDVNDFWKDQFDHLVQTDWHVGLQNKHVKKIKALLK